MSFDFEIAIRTRPVPSDEISCCRIQETDTICKIEIIQQEQDKTLFKSSDRLIFKFDKCFGPTCTQNRVFDYVESKIRSQNKGSLNFTLFCYGQTGAGKTYTVNGGKDFANRGLIPRILEHFLGDEDKQNVQEGH